MILVKIGGSLIAPKNQEGIDNNYLKKISSLFLNFDNIFIAHGTGNIGHGRVKNLIENNPNIDLKNLLIKDFENGRKILGSYFNEIDNYFSGFSRISVEKFIKEDKNKFKNGKYIIGGDVLSTGKIISSDDIIGDMIKYDFVDLVLVLTDVDGVYDKNGKVIQNISKDNFDQIDFWQKENDVTGGMKQKVLKIVKSGNRAIICNGKNFENINNRIQYGHGEGTVIN